MTGFVVQGRVCVFNSVNEYYLHKSYLLILILLQTNMIKISLYIIAF